MRTGEFPDVVERWAVVRPARIAGLTLPCLGHAQTASLAPSRRTAFGWSAAWRDDGTWEPPKTGSYHFRHAARA
ncbi:MAG: hypothetical protein JOZ17_13835 [Acetobacteraceae bacterium]|nr:hypothetical protein [Acetobacteraceae bacterium]